LPDSNTAGQCTIKLLHYFAAVSPARPGCDRQLGGNFRHKGRLWLGDLGGAGESGVLGKQGVELRHSLDPHVAVLDLSFVVSLEEQGGDEPDNALLVGEDADDVSSALHLLVEALERLGAVELGPVLDGEAHLGQAHLLRLRPGAAPPGLADVVLVGDVAPRLGYQ
jgi:hypothetical protein